MNIGMDGKWGNGMKPQDNLSFLNNIDSQIIVKDTQKREIELKIDKLNNQLETLDSELLYLSNQKRILGKAQYGNSVTRKELIRAGMASSDINIRVAANQMEQMGLAEGKDNDLTDEIIDYMILLDNNFRLVNKNSIDPTMLLDKCQEEDKTGGESNDN